MSESLQGMQLNSEKMSKKKRLLNGELSSLPTEKGSRQEYIGSETEEFQRLQKIRKVPDYNPWQKKEPQGESKQPAAHDNRRPKRKAFVFM